MTVEEIIFIFAWTITIGLLFTIPKDRKRLALLAFLFKQLLSLLLGALVVQFDLIAYPVRLFSDVMRASFTFEYFIFPSVCSVFVSYYPYKRSHLYMFAYIAAFCTAITIPEYFLERHTDVIVYLNWSWYWTWITMFVTFALSRRFCVWYFSGLPHGINQPNRNGRPSNE